MIKTLAYVLTFAAATLVVCVVVELCAAPRCAPASTHQLHRVQPMT